MEQQDDLTLVYMWAYKMAEKKYKARIEKLEAALREIADNSSTCYYDIDPPVCLRSKRACAALAGEKNDAPST
jgi:hypothetical protein